MCGATDFVEDAVKGAANHFERTFDAYKQDPERAVLGINTPAETSLWGQILGKKYQPTMTMAGGDTKYDFASDKQKGINPGPAELMNGIATAIATFYAGGALMGAAGAGAGGAEAGAVGTESAVDGGVLSGADVAAADVPAGETTLAEGQAGVSTNGNEFLNSGNASTGSSAPTTSMPPAESQAGVSTDASDFLNSGSGGGNPSMPPAQQTMPPAITDSGVTPASSPSAPSSGGLIQSAMDFAKANPAVTAAGLVVGGGAVQGIGNRASQKEIADRQIQAQRDLQTQRQQQAIELEEWKRKFAQSGSYFDALIPFRRRPAATLTRPSGAPVYQNGLIASQMNNGG